MTTAVPRPPSHDAWLAVCNRLSSTAAASLCPQPAPQLLPRTTAQDRWPVTAFEYGPHPRHLYLQSRESFPQSFLMGAREVLTSLQPAFPVLSLTSAGVAMRLEIEDSSPAADSPHRPAERARRPCAGLAWLNLNLGHPRYAALRRARLVGGQVSRPASYNNFKERVQQLCAGLLSEDDAKALQNDLLDHALQLAGCEQVRMDPRVQTTLDHCNRVAAQCIGDVAPKVGLSASRLSHLFSEETGVSFRQYVLWRRTALAWEDVMFLQQTSLTEIAHSRGFADLAHMSNAFKSVYGYAPSSLREPSRWRVQRQDS